tara:strand:- start:386 stop:679 length:294 start_codon:yes stop_codon:yes gene_type:complete
MSTPLPQSTVIEYAQLTEFRIKLTGGGPQSFSRISLLDSNSAHVAEATFTAFSEATWAKIKELEQSIERDFTQLIETESQAAQDIVRQDEIRWSRTT